MTEKEYQNKMETLIEEIIKCTKEYAPKSQLLNIMISDNAIMVNNNYWGCRTKIKAYAPRFKDSEEIEYDWTI